MILVGAYLTYIGTPPGADPAPGSSRPISRLLGPMLGCVIALVAVFGFVNGIRWARTDHQILGIEAAVTIDIDRIPGPVVEKWLEPAIPVGQLRQDAHTLDAHGLSLYSDAQAVARYRHSAAIDTQEGLFNYKPPPPTQVAHPSNGSVLSGRALLVASAAQDLHPVRVDIALSGGLIGQRVLVTKETIYGWAVLWNTSTVPNGTYQLRSIVDSRSGVRTQSHLVVVMVRN